MKGRVTNIATGTALLRQPSVDSTVTATEYVASLKLCVRSSKEKISVALFERWLTTKSPTPDLTRGEEMIERFAENLRSGRLTDRGRSYSYMFKQAPSDVFALHNRAVVANADRFRRALLPQKSYRHLSRFSRLTDKTKEALTWFLEKGARPPTKPNGSPKPLTAATRNGAAYAALQLLELLNLSGLELVTHELVPEPSSDETSYRSMTRLLHAVSTVYRSCVGRGLLPSNPLSHVSHQIFDGRRDFLTPAMLEKLRDLSSVDLKNCRQVTDRLVCLLYLDSAVRQKELAGVRLDDVRQVDDGYQIVLRPDVQKMQGKPAAVIGLLYPETNRLLGLFLRQYRGTRPGGLISNWAGGDAQGEWLAKAVQREAKRIGLRSYYGEVPSPHDLRRSFATCNSKPLGLGMDIGEIATRLRISIEIAHAHYVVQNPLLSEEKTRAYRKKADENPLAVAADCIEKLAKLGFPATTLKQVRIELERRKSKFIATPGPQQDWIDEDAVFQLIRQRWNVEPNPRKLRPVFARQGCTDRGLARGKIRYRLDAVEKFLNEYAPAHLFAPALSPARLRTVLTDFVTLQVGAIVLIRNVDVSQLMQKIQQPVRIATAAPELLTAS